MPMTFTSLSGQRVDGKRPNPATFKSVKKQLQGLSK